MREVSTPRIVIFGAGSIGCYIGGCLLASGAAVTLLGRARTQQQLSNYGLRLSDWQGSDKRIEPTAINYSLSTSVLAKADYVLVTVKSGDTSEVAKSIAAEATPNAVIVSLQNGVRNKETLQLHLPNHRVIKGMVPFNVVDNGEGHFHCGTEGNLALEGEVGDESELIQALERAGLFVSQYSDLRGVQWSKLLMNLNNAVNALSGIPLLDQLSNASYRQVMAASIKEALQVMHVAGIKPVRTGKVVPAMLPYVLSLPTWLFKRVAASMLKVDPKARSSMYQDLALGRKTEIDYLNGEIVKLAEGQGTSAPINQALLQLVKEAELKAMGSPILSPEMLLKSVVRCG